MSMDVPKKSAFVWVLCACLAAALGALFPPALLVVPAILAFAALRVHVFVLLPSALCALGVRAALGGLGLVGGLLWVLLLCLPALALYTLQKYQYGNFRCVFYASFVFFAAFFAALCLPSILAGEGLYGAVLAPIEQLLALIRESLTELSAFYPESAALFGEYLAALPDADALVELLLPLLYFAAALCALTSTLGMHALNGRKKPVPLCSLQKFGTWVCPRSVLNALCALLGVSIILMLTNLGGVGPFINIVQLLFMLPLGLVGLSVLWQWTGKKRWIFFMFCAGILLLSGFVLPMLAFFAVVVSAGRPRRMEPPKGRA